MINYDEVNKLIGKPWVYLENDCWAVVKEASLKIFGVEIIDQIEFPKLPKKGDTARLVNEQEKRPCWVKTDKIEPGNVLVFNDLRGNPMHVGICIESENILHCMGGQGVKNGRTRYDNLNVIKLLYKKYESYKYVDNDS